MNIVQHLCNVCKNEKEFYISKLHFSALHSSFLSWWTFTIRYFQLHQTIRKNSPYQKISIFVDYENRENINLQSQNEVETKFLNKNQSENMFENSYDIGFLFSVMKYIFYIIDVHKNELNWQFEDISEY